MIENLEEAKALVAKYNSIEKKDIVLNGKTHFWGRAEANTLTGFGNEETCTLCSAVDVKCSVCVYSFKREFNFHGGCTRDEYAKTYNDIADATTSAKLVKTMRKRAIILNTLIKRIEANKS